MLSTALEIRIQRRQFNPVIVKIFIIIQISHKWFVIFIHQYHHLQSRLFVSFFYYCGESLGIVRILYLNIIFLLPISKNPVKSPLKHSKVLIAGCI